MNRAERRYIWKHIRFKGHIKPEDEAVMAKYSEVSGHDMGELRFLYINMKEWDREDWLDAMFDIYRQVDVGDVEIVQ